jgi:TRAP-type C4-dicarboxylate transport system substrate-binding protein
MTNTNWRCLMAALSFMSASIPSSPVSAGEVRLGIPQQKDAFIDSLLESKDLKAAGINLIVVRFPGDNNVLQATIDGSVEVGLFALSALDQIKIDESPRLYTTFTRPFFFQSGEEIFSIQNTALGDAILSDLRRANIFPLKFWNRGLSQIVSRYRISSVQDFQGLKVAAPAAPSLNTLVSLGAEPTQLEAGEPVLEAISHGLVEAAIWEPGARNDSSRWRASQRNVFAGMQIQLFSTDFRPIVGVLSASNEYWSNLSERERQAWKLAVHEASRRSRNQINVSEQNTSRTSNIKFITLSDGVRQELIATMAEGQDATQIERDRIIFEKAKSGLRVSEDTSLKKKN